MTRKYASLDRTDLVAIQNAIMWLRCEVHNPGAYRNLPPDTDLDAIADIALDIVNDCLKTFP